VPLTPRDESTPRAGTSGSRLPDSRNQPPAGLQERVVVCVGPATDDRRATPHQPWIGRTQTPVLGAKAESARDPAPPSHHTSLGQGDTPGVLSRAQGGAGAIRLRTSPHKPGTGRYPPRPFTGPKPSRSDPARPLYVVGDQLTRLMPPIGICYGTSRERPKSSIKRGRASNPDALPPYVPLSWPAACT